MDDDHELNRARQNAHRSAAAILRAAMSGSSSGYRRQLDVFIAAYRGPGISEAILTWCDAVIRAAGGHGSTPVDLRFEHATTGVEGTADQVRAETAWAGRIIVARMMWDRDQFDALVSALPDDEDGVGRHVAALLTMCSVTIRKLREQRAAGPPTPPPAPQGHTWN